MNRTQQAAAELEQAIQLMERAKRNLLYAKSDMYQPLTWELAAIKETHLTLTDPECTPEIMEGKVTP
jgi:hypothetical protein